MNKLELEQKIRIILSEVSSQKGYVSPVDVLMQLGYLSKNDYETWRKGKIEYLEKVCYVNLGKLSTISRTIKKIAEKMKLEPSWTAYNKYGKGPKIGLQFSKSGDKNIENAYSTHYVNRYIISKLKELKGTSKEEKKEPHAGNKLAAETMQA